jgi:hypothetical protein
LSALTEPPWKARLMIAAIARAHGGQCCHSQEALRSWRCSDRQSMELPPHRAEAEKSDAITG